MLQGFSAKIENSHASQIKSVSAPMQVFIFEWNLSFLLRFLTCLGHFCFDFDIFAGRLCFDFDIFGSFLFRL